MEKRSLPDPLLQFATSNFELHNCLLAVVSASERSKEGGIGVAPISGLSSTVLSFVSSDNLKYRCSPNPYFAPSITGMNSSGQFCLGLCLERRSCIRMKVSRSAQSTLKARSNVVSPFGRSLETPQFRWKRGTHPHSPENVLSSPTLVCTFFYLVHE